MLSLVFCFAFISCVVSTPTLKSLEDIRIVGGEDVDITEAPYQVSVLRNGRHTCGGAIVAKDIVITAAHCISGASYPELFEVRVGSSFRAEGGEIYPVGDLIWHPGFDYFKMDSDVAVLWLSKPLEFDDKVAPVEMSDAVDEVADGDMTAVTGWGFVKEGGGYPKQLQRVMVPKVNDKQCTDAYNPTYVITPNMLCAGVPEGGKDACQGDSGGPLVYNNKLAGVVSWGYGCARPDFPGVYAKISALRKWLDDSITSLRMKHILRTV